MSMKTIGQGVTRRVRAALPAAVLLLVLAVLAWLVIHREAYFPGRVLRVAVPDMEIFQGRLSPYGPGPQRELLESFCASHEVDLRWIPISNWEEAWRLLSRGRVDVLLGHGVVSPRGLAARGIIEGPILAETQALLVHHGGPSGQRSASSPCDTPLLFQHSPAIETMLESLCPDLEGQPQGSPLDDVSLLPMLEALSGGEARLGVADKASFRVWQPLYPHLRTVSTLPETIQTRWYISSRRKWLADSILEFLSGERLAREMSRLESRYWGFFPQDTSLYELNHMRRTVRNVLPRYREAILEAAGRERIDPLLLTAVIYQESRFRSRARSHTGVRGLMQLNLDTARMLGVTNRLDPLQSIHGGSSYLRMLNNRLKPLVQDPWERWFLTLASYNQGFGHTEDAMALAAQLNLEPDRWRDVKQAFKLLTKKKYYKQATYGYTRGYEAEAYVENIRYFYYVLYSLALVPGLEADELAPLALAIPEGWPDV